MLAAMHLTLVRHGDAGASTNSLGDSGRCLSTLGREQARATGRALAERGVTFTHVWTSPLVRAVQTTELILAQLDYEGRAEARDHLFPDSRAGELIEALRGLDDAARVLAVGHMPYMAATAGELLGIHVGGFGTAHAYNLELRSLAPLRAELSWRWLGRFVD